MAHKYKVINRNIQPIVTENFAQFANVLAMIKTEEGKSKTPKFITSIKDDTILAMIEILSIS